MKNAIVLVVAILTATNLFAQEQPTNKAKTDSTIQKAAQKVGQTGGRDRLVIDFSYENWIRSGNAKTTVTTKGFGLGFNFYFFYDILLGKSRFSVAPGIGFGVTNVRTSAQLIKRGDYKTVDTTNIPLYDNTKTNFAAFTDSQKISKYRINTSYVDIPLEIRYRSKPNKSNKSIKVAAGFKIGLLMEDHSRITSTASDGNTQVTKISHYTDISSLRYGPTIRIGYGPFNVFAYYGLGDFFTVLGPETVHPISVGISINGL